MPPRLAKGIEMIDQENRDGINIDVNISHVVLLYGDGIEDVEVIKKAKELGAILVSEDPDFYTIQANKQLIKKMGIGCVVYKPPKAGIRFWEKSLAFINGWEELKEKVRESTAPFLIRIDKNGHSVVEHL